MKLKSTDSAFSRYIRQVDSIDDICTCPLCGTRGHWTTFQAGHYIKRRHLATRWNMDNVFAICADCNSRMENDSGLLEKYGRWIAERIGPQRWRELMNLRLVDGKMMQHEVNEIEKHYLKLLK